MEDTVTLARQEREKQGPWEAEVSYGGEADLHKHLTCCNKNPGHQNFIPVDQFNVEHLPPGCHDNYLVDFVRALSDLTVRVSVKYVSDSRRETVPGSNKPYPCYKDRGRDMMRTGTGWLSSVVIYPDDYDKSYTTCECKECVNSPTPKTQFAHIYIHTAAHVVYDDQEAAHTTCHLFFDKGSTPDVCSGVVTLSGMSVVRCHPEKDRIVMKYVTHDLDLSHKLIKLLKSFLQLCSSRPRVKNSNMESSSGNLIPRTDTMYIIVSHPHGCSRQVSVGRYIDTKKREDGLVMTIYNTPTCPGSSGARVFAVANTNLDIAYDCVHRGGHCEGDLQENFSTFDIGYCLGSDFDSDAVCDSDSSSDSVSDSDSHFLRGLTPSPTQNPRRAPLRLKYVTFFFCISLIFSHFCGRFGKIGYWL